MNGSIAKEVVKMWWNNKNQLISEDDNILATVEWDYESQSWEFINKLNDTGIYGFSSKAEARMEAEASVKDTLEEREDDAPMNPPDTIFNLGLYGMF